MAALEPKERTPSDGRVKGVQCGLCVGSVVVSGRPHNCLFTRVVGVGNASWYMTQDHATQVKALGATRTRFTSGLAGDALNRVVSCCWRVAPGGARVVVVVVVVVNRVPVDVVYERLRTGDSDLELSSTLSREELNRGNPVPSPHTEPHWTTWGTGRLGGARLLWVRAESISNCA